MNSVEPIRNTKTIERMRTHLNGMDKKYGLLFTLGMNTGLRVSDLLKLKVKDVANTDHVTIIEQKTGKKKTFYLNSKLRKKVRDFLKPNENKLDEDDYLFCSRKHDENGKSKPISRVQAYRVLNEAADAVGIKEPIGTHTMRKTFGFHYYKRTHDVATLQKIFNHSAPSITLRYIGIEQDQIDDTLKDFFL